MGLVLATLGLGGTIPIFVWGSNGAPEFYGAFTAAIVAAVAVILGAYYQSELTRKRDELLAKQGETAEAIDLCFWLEHAASEVDFIVAVLTRIHDQLVASDADQLMMPPNQFRQIVSARFFDELLPKAKVATRLPTKIAGPIVRTIYKTFHVADRILLLRGAEETFKPTMENIDTYIFVLTNEAKKLRDASMVVENHLTSTGAMIVASED